MEYRRRASRPRAVAILPASCPLKLTQLCLLLWPHDWVKSKNPAEPAVKRRAEEDWGKERNGSKWTVRAVGTSSQGLPNNSALSAIFPCSASGLTEFLSVGLLGHA